MDNRGIAAERFIDERQYEARRAVERARLQRETLAGAEADRHLAGGLSRRLWYAFRRIQNLQRETTQQVPARVQIRR